MDRRTFLRAGGGTAAGVGLAAAAERVAGATGRRPRSVDMPEIEWEMPTSWPANLDTIFGGAVAFAETVGLLTDGRFAITARAGGELIPPLEILQNVQSGAYPIGHTAAYYYTGLAEFTAFGTSVPFGLNARQQTSWLYEGGGLELLQGLYAERFNAIQFPAGNTGCQMGGWFNTEITSVDDLSGLRMRIPGLGGRIMDRLGVAVQQLPGGEIYQAMQTGAIDAAEWVGPYDDVNLGFPEVAQYYYYPGWWEAGPSLEVQISLSEWEGLPPIYQEVVRAAAQVANQTMMARYDTLNPQSFAEIEGMDGITVSEYPADVIEAARTESFALYDELAGQDEGFASVYESWNAYRETAQRWWGITELSINRISTEGG